MVKVKALCRPVMFLCTKLEFISLSAELCGPVGQGYKKESCLPEINMFISVVSDSEAHFCTCNKPKYVYVLTMGHVTYLLVELTSSLVLKMRLQP